MYTDSSTCTYTRASRNYALHSINAPASWKSRDDRGCVERCPVNTVCGGCHIHVHNVLRKRLGLVQHAHPRATTIGWRAVVHTRVSPVDAQVGRWVCVQRSAKAMCGVPVRRVHTSPDGATFHLVATHRALCCLSFAHSFGNLVNDMQTLHCDFRYHTPCHISSVPLHAWTAQPHQSWACQQAREVVMRHSLHERQSSEPRILHCLWRGCDPADVDFEVERMVVQKQQRCRVTVMNRAGHNHCDGRT